MVTIASETASRSSTTPSHVRPGPTLLIVLVLLSVVTAAVHGGAPEQLAAAVVAVATACRLLARRAPRQKAGGHRG
ncbi:hypothetical protein [Streptomyces sp. NPDC058625]|uniref:hypothetical protein n=1 Tax=Streptomyces sp. NPDC058625 TaxID=3346564 RepID=UPI00365467A2